MVYIEKSQPAPECLAIERKKKSGKYDCGDVLDRLRSDFRNKCYICEAKAPISINVEHLKPHKNNPDLKFDWNNLFFACAHCNNTKLAKYDNILNCTDPADDVEHKLKYSYKPFPLEKVYVEALDSDERTMQTQQLLHAVYNGTTKLKSFEAENLKTQLCEEISSFLDWIEMHLDNLQTPIIRSAAEKKIADHLSRDSAFTAIKRALITENESLNNLFGKYLD